MKMVKNNMDKTSYQIRKERARKEAIDWQMNCENHNYSFSEVHEYTQYFYRLAKRYGLIQEFEENGII